MWQHKCYHRLKKLSTLSKPATILTVETICIVVLVMSSVVPLAQRHLKTFAKSMFTRGSVVSMSDMNPMAPPIAQPSPPERPRSSRPSISRHLHGEAGPSWQRISLSLALIVGLLTLGGVGLFVWNWVHSLQIPDNPYGPPPAITTLKVQRSAPYAGLTFTLIDAQYANAFADDLIQAGPAVVRLHLEVVNTSGAQISVIYYDAAHLLLPDGRAVAPSNVKLAVALAPHQHSAGWLDFPVAQGIKLAGLKLQLGSMTLNESLVIVPFSGPFTPEIYAAKVTPQSLAISYTYNAQPGLYLTYHLVSAERAFSYGSWGQVKAGQQFYILNFRVDNPNGVAVNPGRGFDYIRLVLGASVRAPLDSTLPTGFKAGAHNVAGSVMFSAPAGLRTLVVRFLYQYGQGGNDYTIQL
jgi:hypothetical protein